MLGLVLFAGACQTSRQSTAGKEALPQALLWKIEGNGLAQPSYLFGTIHIMPSDDYFYPAGFDQAFDRAERVVFEIDLKEMDDIGSMMGLLTGIMMKGGATIRSLLSPAEYKEVSAYFDEMGLPMMLLEKVKPMFLAMMAEADMSPESGESDGMQSYEMELNARAESDGKPTGGLETMAYQMSLFDSIPYEQQAHMLVEAVRGHRGEGDTYAETVRMYKEQRIDDMVTMIQKEGRKARQEENYEDVLLVNRNRNWIPVMGRMMREESVLFAVGAGHLGGREGVVRLLRQAGYTLSPVSVYKPGLRQI